MWSLTLEGKIKNKTLAISKIVYLWMMIKVPTEIIVELKKIQKRFIWSTKPKTTQYLPISKTRVLKMRMHHFSWCPRVFKSPHFLLISPMCWSPPNILVTLSLPTYRQTEICSDTQEEFEQIYIIVNAYHRNKTTSKIK